jgi:hypothetical protein
MELILGSETSTHFNQTPGLHPKENTLHQQHGESLKTKKLPYVILQGCKSLGYRRQLNVLS